MGAPLPGHPSVAAVPALVAWHPPIEVQVEIGSVIGPCPRCADDVRLDDHGEGYCVGCAREYRVEMVARLTERKEA